MGRLARGTEPEPRIPTIMSVWLGSNLHVIVSSSKLAKEVLKENDQQLADRNMSISFARFTRDGNDANYGPHYVKV